MITKIRKRDGSVVLFQTDKITDAIWKAVKAVGGSDKSRAEQLSNLVINELSKKYPDNSIPGVEEVQDLIEKILIDIKLDDNLNISEYKANGSIKKINIIFHGYVLYNNEILF